MSVSYGGDSIVFADGSINASGFIGHRNRIINGGMTVWQRATTVTGSTGYSSVDRWDINGAGGSTLNVAQSTDVPSGFSYSTAITVGTASSAAGAYSYALYAIEGYNIADFNWGTASAIPVTLSFWVKSSVTGTFGLILRNTGTARYYTTTYTINTANTWEYKTITIAGDTAGTWLITNGIGLQLIWDLGVGSTYSSASSNAWSTVASNYFGVPSTTKLASTASATFYITGVQLERGSTASSFEYRSYGAELALCQRYFQKLAGGTVIGSGATDIGLSIPFALPMRSSPSVGQTGVLTIENMGTSDITQSSTSISIRSGRINTVGGVFSMSNFSGLTQFRPYLHNVNHSGTDNYITLSAEL